MLRAVVTTAILCLFLASEAACGGQNGQKQWTDSAMQPNSFSPWSGAESINLPASRAAFERFALRNNAEVFDAGGSDIEMLTVPKPDISIPDLAGALYVRFETDPADGVIRTYIAYYNNAGDVVYVKEDFGYPPV